MERPTLSKSKKMIVRLSDDEETGGASIAACTAIIVRAWHCLRNDQPITPGRLKLTWEMNSSGISSLVEMPTVGGIDRGDDEIDGEEGAEEPRNHDPTPEAIEERSAKVRTKKTTTKGKRQTLKKPTTKKRRTKKGNGQTFNVGDQVWINDPDGDHWDGEFVETYQTDEGATVARIKTLGGKEYEAPIEQVQTEEP